MKVLGIDPGLAKCGVACVQGTKLGRNLKLLHTERLTTTPKQSLTGRLGHVSDSIRRLCIALKPDKIVCEMTFMGRGPRNSLDLAQARGAILAAVRSCGIDECCVTELHPTTMKKLIADDGRAEKYEIERTIRQALAIGDDRKLTPDEADACGLALCYWRAQQA